MTLFQYTYFDLLIADGADCYWIVKELLLIDLKLSTHIKGKDILWNCSFRAFHEIQLQGHFMKHDTLSWNTFILVSKFHCVCFSSIKKILFTEKRYFNSIKQYLLLIKQKQNNSKRPKLIQRKPWFLTNRNDKNAYFIIFSELLLKVH